MSAASRPAPWRPTVILADEDRKPVTELEELWETVEALAHRLAEKEHENRQLRKRLLEMKQAETRAMERRR